MHQNQSKLFRSSQSIMHRLSKMQRLLQQLIQSVFRAIFSNACLNNKSICMDASIDSHTLIIILFTLYKL